MSQAVLLRDASIQHAGVKPVLHPRLKTTIHGQTAVRYLRFGRRVRLDRLELPRSVQGRWVPSVPTHPPISSSPSSTRKRSPGRRSAW